MFTVKRPPGKNCNSLQFYLTTFYFRVVALLSSQVHTSYDMYQWLTINLNSTLTMFFFVWQVGNEPRHLPPKKKQKGGYQRLYTGMLNLSECFS